MRQSSPPSFLQAWLPLLGLLAGVSFAAAVGATETHGRVLGSDNGGLAGATVELLELLPPNQVALRELAQLESPESAAPLRRGMVQADVEGHFSLAVPLGVWSFRAAAPGYVPRCIPHVTVVGGRRLPTVRLEAGLRHRLRVVDEKGQAVAGALVRTVPAVEDEGLWGECRLTLRSDEQGVVRMPVPGGERPARAVWVEIFRPGFLEERQEVGGEVTVTLRRAPSVAWELRLAEAEPATAPPPVVVAVAGRGRWPVGKSDAEGRLLLSSQPGPVGDLRLLATDGRRLEVPLGDRGNQTPVPLRLPRSEIYRGRVRTYAADSWLQVPDAVVWSTHEPGQWTVSGRDGVYELRNVLKGHDRQGEVILEVSGQAAGYHREDMWLGFFDGRRRETPAGVVFTGLGLAVLLSSTDGLRGVVGRVVGPEGEGVSRAHVEVFSSGQLPSVKQIIEQLAGILPLHDEPGVHHGDSDAEGTFVLGADPYLYDVVITHPEFAPGVFRRVEVPAEPDPVKLGEFRLSRGHSVEGRVADPEGTPLDGVSVELLYPAVVGDENMQAVDQRLGPTHTNPQGLFRLALLPELDLDLRLRLDGFAEAVLAVHPPLSQPLQIVLERAARLRGQVVDSGEAPIEGAWVRIVTDDSGARLTPSYVGKPVPGSITDAEGGFAFEDLTAGRWRLLVEAEGYAPAELGGLVLLAGEERRDSRVRLSRGARLSGTVRDAEGLPVAGVRLQAAGQYIISAADGSFLFPGPVAPGRIVVAAHHRAAGQDRVSVEVTGDDEVQVELRLQSQVVLVGRVVDASGRRVQDSGSVFLRSAYGSLGSADVDSGGRFEVKDLVPGRYWLKVYALRGRSWLDGEEEVVLEAGTSEIELIVEPRGEIAGRVVGLTPEELRSVQVQWLSEAHPGSRTKVRSDGAFVFELPLGEAVVSASVNGTTRSAAEPVSLTVEQPRVEVELQFGSGSALAGRVWHNGQPLGGASVAWVSRNVHVVAGRTDWEGRFSLEEVSAGPGALQVEPLEQDFQVNHRVEASRGGDLEIRIETALLRGTVVEVGGAPVPHADLVLVSEAVPLAPSAGRREQRRLRSDSNGAFALPRVPVGRYRLVFLRFGQGVSSIPVHVEGEGENVVHMIVSL